MLRHPAVWWVGTDGPKGWTARVSRVVGGPEDWAGVYPQECNVHSKGNETWILIDWNINCYTQNVGVDCFNCLKESGSTVV